MKHFGLKYLLLFALFTQRLCDASAQSIWRVEYSPLPIEIGKELSFSNKPEAKANIINTYSKLLVAGYLDARMDTVMHDSTISVNVEAGKRWLISSILWMQDSVNPIRNLDIVWKKPKPFSGENLNAKLENVIGVYENNGYPFVSAQLNKMDVNDNKVNLVFDVSKGPLILMDSIIFRSQSKIPKRYVRNYLDIRKGDLYSEIKLRGLEKKLKEIPFITSRQPSEIRFKQGKADLFVFIEKKRANYFNGILGIRPDDKTGKVNFTGDVEIKLANAFNGGEEIYLNWRKMQALTQDLTAKTMLPYLFNTPIGLDGQLKIYKRDSTFTSTKTALGMLFNFGGMNRIRVFVEKNSTNQLSSFITAQPLANVNSTFYGLSAQIEKLDYRFNPRKGYSILMEGATGVRKVASNNQLSEQEVNKSISKNVHRIDVQLDYYIPTWKKQCVRLFAQGVGLFAPSIYENEMYRLGGLRTLRGVDEESINASSYAIGTFEYRFLFEENSALYVFADQSWYERKSATSFLTDTPLGFGAGVNFETKSGIFTFNYAIGQQFNNPILVRNAKISFGFRNIF